MATSYTAALRNQFIPIGADPANFAAEFDRWKGLGEAGEYSNYLFGKDGAYVRPKVDGEYLLRHTHLVPLQDLDALAKWDKAWRHRGRKTSDRALVYTSHPRHGHLLIFILNEPDAHDIASMSCEKDAKTMRLLAKVADAFQRDGRIIA